MTYSRKIAITGLGCCCSAGQDVPSTWESVKSNSVNWLPGESDFFQPHRISPLFAVGYDNITTLFSPSFTHKIQSTHLIGINRTIALSLAATTEALHQAQIDLESLASLRVGVALGTTVGCTFHNEPYYIKWKKGEHQSISPVFNYLSSNLAERIQQILQINGPRAVITNACASGTDAIGIAKQWLENDLCDLAIAGGADEISRIACHGFSSLMLFSKDPCRPFDKDRSGLNLGEGAGVVVLENDNLIESRKTKPIGWIRGYGSACDAYHPTAPHPEGRGLQKAVQLALQNGAVTMDQISYINAHGTGTLANDQAELTALAKLGTATNKDITIVSTKGITGHTLGAAGAIEAVLTLMSLRNGCAFGTAGCREQDSRLPLQVLPENQSTMLKGNLGMSQSLAFGGGNSALILEAAKE